MRIYSAYHQIQVHGALRLSIRDAHLALSNIENNRENRPSTFAPIDAVF